MSELVERLKAAKPHCGCGGDPLAVRKTCSDYGKCTANDEAAAEITRLAGELAVQSEQAQTAYRQLMMALNLLSASQARVAVLEEALRPFAEYEDAANEAVKNPNQFPDWYEVEARIEAGAFRQAARAMEGK